MKLTMQANGSQIDHCARYVMWWNQGRDHIAHPTQLNSTQLASSMTTANRALWSLNWPVELSRIGRCDHGIQINSTLKDVQNLQQSTTIHYTGFLFQNACVFAYRCLHRPGPAYLSCDLKSASNTSSQQRQR